MNFAKSRMQAGCKSGSAVGGSCKGAVCPTEIGILFLFGFSGVFSIMITV